jgi:signal recognition particle subunit SRP68
MEVDAPAEGAAPVQFSLNVLDIVRTAQGLHGLKHSEYLRYRYVKTRWMPITAIIVLTKVGLTDHSFRSINHHCREYCSRRLRRIYKGVKFLHGRSRFQKKKLEPETITDER